MRPVLSGSHPIDLFKIPCEVAFIAHTDSVHDLFDAQECSFQKSTCFLHPERPQILRGRHPRLCLEQIAQMRQRQVDGACYLAGEQLSVQVFLHEAESLLHSLIHIQFAACFFSARVCNLWRRGSKVSSCVITLKQKDVKTVKDSAAGRIGRRKALGSLTRESALGRVAASVRLLHKAGHSVRWRVFAGFRAGEEKRRENYLYCAFRDQRCNLVIILRLRRCAGFFAGSKFLCRP